MRIAYVTNVRLPSERAHGHQIAQVCDAFAELGHTVDLYAPYRINPVREDYRAYYGARKEVTLKILGSFDAIRSVLLPGVAGLWTQNALLRQALVRPLSAGGYDLLYTRAPALLGVLLSMKAPVVLELHQLPRFGRGAFVSRCNTCRLVVCLTSAMRDTLKEWGVNESVLRVEGDAVDAKRFENLPSTEEARKALGLSTRRTVVGYVGRLKTLGMEKGVGSLLNAVAAFKEKEAFFGLIVGGPARDKAQYEAQAAALELDDDDVAFTGDVPAAKVPDALAACDILAMPFPDLPHYRRNMSPLKMFEYMAAGKVIVTSDLPTIRDVLSEKTAVFCTPGDDASLKDALQWILAHPGEAKARADAAKELSRHYTWTERMKRILSNISG